MASSLAIVSARPTTVDAALSTAAEPARFVPVAPCRLLDTRVDPGDPIAAGGVIDVEVVGDRCGVPDRAVAAAFSVVAIDPDDLGYVTVWPAGEPRPTASVLNYRSGQVVPNAQIVRLGDGGRISLFTRAGAHLAVDVTGWFEAIDGPVSAGRFVPVEQQRVVDTRRSGRPSPAGVVSVDLAGEVGEGAVAAVVNITTTQSSGPGYFTAYPEGVTRPTASVLNTDRAGQTRAATAIVPLDATGRFDVFTLLGDHVVIDLAGYFTGPSAEPSTDGLFVAATPARLVDTRLKAGASGGPRLWDGGARVFPTETVTGGPVAAVAANLTMTATEDPGYVTAGPARVPIASVSSVNASAAQATVANSAIVATSTAGISVRTLEATHLVVDITGWFAGTPLDATAALPANTPPADRRVLIISDSAMAGVRWNGALEAFRGFHVDARLESCRRLVQGSCRGREGYIPLTAQSEILTLPAAGPEDLLVIAVGYNDWHSRFASDFDQVVATARSRGFHHIAWVSYRSRVGYTLPGSDGIHSNYGEMNRILRDKLATGDYPEVRLWDLDEYTWPAPDGWFYADGVHETVLGSWGVADWISRHVRAFDDRPCAEPWRPGRTVASPCPDPDLLPESTGFPAIAGLYGV